MKMDPEILKKKFEEEIEVFKKIQKDLTKAGSLRSQLDGQLNENNLVKEELDLLEPEAAVFKLIGPALIRQDLGEAKQTVNKRIDYISAEIKRHEGSIEKLEKDQDSKKEILAKIQNDLQQLMVKSAAASK